MELGEKSKPRKLAKEDTIQLKKQLGLAMEDVASDSQPLPIRLMQDLATNFCEVAPEDVTIEKLISNVPNESA